MVRLEQTSYTISESDEVVIICIITVGANTQCPSTDPFQVTLSTTNQNAGIAVVDISVTKKASCSDQHCVLFSTVSPTDYEAVDETLMFSPCETQRCLIITIINDLISEPEKTFSLSLTGFPNTPSPITLTLTSGEVVITDDDGSLRPSTCVL